MSNIWHKAGFHEAIDDKLKVSKDGKWVYWTMYGWNIPGKDVHDIGCEWAYLDDLLALETELERTRKALGVATDAIDEILYLDSGKFCKEPAEMWKIAKSAKDKISTGTKRISYERQIQTLSLYNSLVKTTQSTVKRTVGKHKQCVKRKRTKGLAMTSCCDNAIDNGTLVYKGRATIVCPTCGKDQMLKLVYLHDCGYEYMDGKGLKKIKAEQKE